MSHWPQRLAPLGSARDASSRLLRLMLLLFFFLVTSSPVLLFNGSRALLLFSNFHGLLQPHVHLTSSSCPLCPYPRWWEAGTFFPSPPPPSFRLPSCSSVPPRPFSLPCLVQLIMSVHSLGRDSHILCLLPVLSCYPLLPRDVRVLNSRAFFLYPLGSCVNLWAISNRRLDDSLCALVRVLWMCSSTRMNSV